MSVQQQLDNNRSLSLWIMDTLANDLHLSENDRCKLKSEWCVLQSEHSRLEMELVNEHRTDVYLSMLSNIRTNVNKVC
jgi:hypothetical protein